MQMADTLSADIVVIGSGICGSLAARKLAAAGASVLILEAGPRVDRGMLTANFRNSPRKGDFMSPYPYSPLAPHPDYQPQDNNYLIQKGPAPYKAEYIRVVGGTSWHWAAQAWRLLPNDLRLHSLYGVGRDWPISYDDIEPYYYEAEVLMGVSGR
jgi:choline dehydrogenase-like flavoprotein